MKLFVSIILVPVALAFGAAACTQRPVDVDGQPTAGPAGSAAAVDADVFSKPEAYVGQAVRLEALFQGYRIDQCHFAPAARSVALTRSDWLVRHEAMCLYVTGGIPAGLDPVDPGATGRQLELRARVIEDGDGKFVLKLLEARPL